MNALETFDEESIISFDRRSLKFCDYLEAVGRSWTEEEKVAD